MTVCCGNVAKYSWTTSLFFDWWIIFIPVPLMNLSLSLSNPAKPIKYEKSIWLDAWHGQKEIRWFFLSFPCSSSLFLKVSSIWNAPPLNYFTYSFPPYLPTIPHCVAGCFYSYDSTASSSLTGSFIPLSPVWHPSFAFSSSLLSFLFITDCGLQPVHFQRTPWSRSSFTTEPSADKTWDCCFNTEISR